MVQQAIELRIYPLTQQRVFESFFKIVFIINFSAEYKSYVQVVWNVDQIYSTCINKERISTSSPTVLGISPTF